MPYCYIIYSNAIDSFYTGACLDQLSTRIINHNNSKYGSKHFTARANDWSLVLKIEVPQFQHAIRIERKIKAMKSKNYIRNLAKYPELVQKIISQTSK
jgi:putative endonuclease